MRLSYHGWAATLLVAEFLLVVGGMALVASSSSAIVLPNGDSIATCASASAAAGARCAGAEARETFGVLMIGAGFLLFGGQLLVGMLIAGVRDALANAPQQVVTTAGPEPSRPAPQA